VVKLVDVANLVWGNRKHGKRSRDDIKRADLPGSEEFQMKRGPALHADIGSEDG
jgi:hypothetical protein